jgi:NAD(P)-dependent dehydrogenase (short-subunit alcohol dehydrogenase family)
LKASSRSIKGRRCCHFFFFYSLSKTPLLLKTYPTLLSYKFTVDITSKMPANSVALILGYGPGIGASVAKKLASNGYKVAVASRSGGSSPKTTEGFLSLKADFTKPHSIPALFKAVNNEFNAAPSVVIYNAAVRTPPPVNNSIFSTSADTLVSDFDINTISPYIAAQQAVSEWDKLPKEIKKSFIYTGNILNVSIIPSPIMMTLGMGKSASAYWIGLADALHSSQGIRWGFSLSRLLLQLLTSLVR